MEKRSATQEKESDVRRSHLQVVAGYQTWAHGDKKKKVRIDQVVVDLGHRISAQRSKYQSMS